MERFNLKKNCALALVFAGIMAVGQTYADKPSGAGGGKGEKNNRSENSGRMERSDNKGNEHRGGDRNSRRDDDGSRSRVSAHFGDRHWERVNHYYSEQFRGGNCPPGLAKKHNGCMPPGQAKRWSVGQPLARSVVYYDVPPALVVEFGPPPRGQRYVRVDSDILLIALGTGLVIDGIQNLGRR